MAKTREAQREGTAEWLEAQLRDARARLHKVEGELHQSLKHLWTLDTDVKKMREASAAAAPMGGILQGLREEMRQLRDQVSRIQDRQSALIDKVDQVSRLRQAEGRDGPEIGLLVKQTDALSRALEQQSLRTQSLEEVGRQVEEELAGARLSNQAVERAMAELQARVTRAHQAALGIEQQLASAGGELEKLRNEGGALSDRLNLLVEGVRRTAERLDKLENNLDSFPEEMREAVQTADFEREQLAQRVGAVERVAGEVAERLEEVLQAAARLDQRTQGQAGQLLTLGGQIQDMSEQMNASLKKLSQLLLRQRRRQGEAIAQEIKELSQGEFQGRD